MLSEVTLYLNRWQFIRSRNQKGVTRCQHFPTFVIVPIFRDSTALTVSHYKTPRKRWPGLVMLALTNALREVLNEFPSTVGLFKCRQHWQCNTVPYTWWHRYGHVSYTWWHVGSLPDCARSCSQEHPTSFCGHAGVASRANISSSVFCSVTLRRVIISHRTTLNKWKLRKDSRLRGVALATDVSGRT
jgi:hypothetical protein